MKTPHRLQTTLLTIQVNMAGTGKRTLPCWERETHLFQGFMGNFDILKTHKDVLCSLEKVKPALLSVHWDPRGESGW